MTGTDARGARSAGEPRSQGGSLTKRGRASPISGGWAPEGLTTHKITAETFPSQERASPRDPCGETIPGWKEAKRFSAPRPRGLVRATTPGGLAWERRRLCRSRRPQSHRGRGAG